MPRSSELCLHRPLDARRPFSTVQGRAAQSVNECSRSLHRRGGAVPALSLSSAARFGLQRDMELDPGPHLKRLHYLFIYFANSAQCLLSLAELRRDRQVEVNGTKHLATHQLFTLHLILIQVKAGGR